MDVLGEALAGIVQRPGRAALSILGTAIAIAVASFVAVLGLTSTANGQISDQFTKLSATEVTLTDTGNPDKQGPGFDAGSEQRVRSIRGVEHAGVFWTAQVGREAVSATPDSTGNALPVAAAAPDFLRAVHAQASAGMLYDEFHSTRRERVVVLGSAAANRLGITRVDSQPAIFIQGVAMTVVGILGDVDRHPELLLSVIVPDTTATDLWGQPDQADGAKMLIESGLGAASVVARQAVVAARPDTPDRLTVTAPPDPRGLRDSVTHDLNSLFLALSGVALVVGAIGIANTMLVAVMERVPEIGLRRALGSGRGQIALQFIGESSTIGLIGGILGASVGIAVVVTVAAVRQWTPLLEPWSVTSSPILGSLTGLFAGLYPSYRAARVEPADALRR